jgi:hypothetical protein
MKVVVKGSQALDRPKDQMAASWTASDNAALAEVVHAASEAVTTLADRLNALALRTALLGGVADSFGAEANVEGYLTRLSSLVTSAGDQMRRIQKVLRVLESTTTLKIESQTFQSGKVT